MLLLLPLLRPHPPHHHHLLLLLLRPYPTTSSSSSSSPSRLRPSPSNALANSCILSNSGSPTNPFTKHLGSPLALAIAGDPVRSKSSPASDDATPFPLKKSSVLQRNARVLGRLVPGGRKLSFPTLLEETTTAMSELAQILSRSGAKKKKSTKKKKKKQKKQQRGVVVKRDIWS